MSDRPMEKQRTLSGLCACVQLCPGHHKNAPPNFAVNKMTVSPEVARGLMQHGTGEIISGPAHDVWGLGTLLLAAFINERPWRIQASGDLADIYASVHLLHAEWVSTCPRG